VIEVPRRQSTGRNCPREIVAEVEEENEEVEEGEQGEGVKRRPVMESVFANEVRPRCVQDCPMLRFVFMAAPENCAARFNSRVAKIASGPEKKLYILGRARSSPTDGRI
jgi:hypothetical protein